MKKIAVYIAIVINVTTLTRIWSQADISMSTHWYNRANYNPAFIARTDYAYLFSNIRDQWTGIDGAPRVINVQASEYIHNIRSAFGLSYINDKIGASQVQNPMATYAYRIAEEFHWSLSMGLAIGMFSRTVDGTKFEADVVNDPSVHYYSEKTMGPDANAGIEFQNNTFIFGLSSTHLTSIGKKQDSYLNSNHRYVYAIYKNNNSDLFFYKVGLQVVNRYNLTALEGNLFIRLKHGTGLMSGPREIFDFGITCRTSRQITLAVGLLVTPDFRVGYAYDQSFISGYLPNGTHEIFLEYRFRNKLAEIHPKCGEQIHWYK